MTASGVVIVDYGAGNLVSIRNALELLGAAPSIASTPDAVAGAAVIVVPGVGASGPAMERLERHGLADPIRDAVRGGAWYVGICLGLQLLFERSEEDGARMLGLLPGDVTVIADAPRLPHIGWNQLERTTAPRPARGCRRRRAGLLRAFLRRASRGPEHRGHGDRAWQPLPEHHRDRAHHRLPAAPGAVRLRWAAAAAQHAGRHRSVDRAGSAGYPRIQATIGGA